MVDVAVCALHSLPMGVLKPPTFSAVSGAGHGGKGDDPAVPFGPSSYTWHLHWALANPAVKSSESNPFIGFYKVSTNTKTFVSFVHFSDNLGSQRRDLWSTQHLAICLIGCHQIPPQASNPLPAPCREHGHPSSRL